VCLIRIEAEEHRLLITIRSTPDISDQSTETVARYSDIEAAVAAARSFLEKFSLPPSAI
jgi:hypothetical protein